VGLVEIELTAALPPATFLLIGARNREPHFFAHCRSSIPFAARERKDSRADLSSCRNNPRAPLEFCSRPEFAGALNSIDIATCAC
jgi:hypothetical protein